MGAKVSRTDFEWVYTEEPHASRRKIILEKYPQIKKLFGHDPYFKWIVSGLVMTQLLSLHFLQRLSWPMLLLVVYCFGAVINHSLMTAIHEICHNVAFGHAQPTANRVFGMFANLPLAVPGSVSFKKYHLEHHRSLAHEGLDPDLPTDFEARLFRTTGGKLFWLAFMPFFYFFRPLIVRPLPMDPLEAINLVVQMLFNTAIVQLYGWKMYFYLFLSTFLGFGIHPSAGHFISEHYMFIKGFETYSYYGPLNIISFNVGYHMEHHDFPAVPWNRLPEIKRIAPEFYEDLPHHTSLITVMYDFITDPNIGLYSRVKRRARGIDN